MILRVLAVLFMALEYMYSTHYRLRDLLMREHPLFRDQINLAFQEYSPFYLLLQ